jgi:hypothetical protein
MAVTSGVEMLGNEGALKARPSYAAKLRRAGRRSFNHLASRRGYVKLGDQDSGLDAGFEQIYAHCRRFTMTSAERMFSLYKAVEYVVNADVPGDVVECGVWRGGSSMLAAESLLHFGDSARQLYLFDTFSGMAKPSVVDGSGAMDKWRRTQTDDHNEWCYASRADVERNMGRTGVPADRIHLIEGRVQDTLPSPDPEVISLLRLDTDWYESSYHELEHLYPRLSPGGVLILDDYGHWEGQRRAVDEYFRGQGDTVLLNRIDRSGRIGIKTGH